MGSSERVRSRRVLKRMAALHDSYLTTVTTYTAYHGCARYKAIETRPTSLHAPAYKPTVHVMHLYIGIPRLQLTTMGQSGLTSVVHHVARQGIAGPETFPHDATLLHSRFPIFFSVCPTTSPPSHPHCHASPLRTL